VVLRATVSGRAADLSSCGVAIGKILRRQRHCACRTWLVVSSVAASSRQGVFDDNYPRFQRQLCKSVLLNKGIQALCSPNKPIRALCAWVCLGSTMRASRRFSVVANG
jgi:hypothetical protein